MRNAIVTVTREIIGNAHILSFPERPRPYIVYQLPLYRGIVSGTNTRGSRISKEFEPTRFGVHRTWSREARIVGLADEQTYNGLGLYYYHARRSLAAYVSFFIHRGPHKPLGANMGSIGCVEICGAGEWDRFNNTIKSFTGL
ncbi:MAG: hypothetical protein OIF50_00640 [Flavobacteriaceae bacterium]|nr:hypothetical protein [Flavobacteriaceae bacterium]